MVEFMVLAYFITFSTYGTWLHGTAKAEGSVDRHHNTFGEPLIGNNPALTKYELCRMKAPPFSLDATQREITRDSIIAICQEKIWRLLALHVRTNHVHLVVSADREPGRLMSDIKARASRDLNGFNLKTSIRWTRHGSTRHLFDEASVSAAIAYTLYEQGPPMAIYDGRMVN